MHWKVNLLKNSNKNPKLGPNFSYLKVAGVRAVWNFTIICKNRQISWNSSLLKLLIGPDKNFFLKKSWRYFLGFEKWFEHNNNRTFSQHVQYGFRVCMPLPIVSEAFSCYCLVEIFCFKTFPNTGIFQRKAYRDSKTRKSKNDGVGVVWNFRNICKNSSNFGK